MMKSLMKFSPGPLSLGTVLAIVALAHWSGTPLHAAQAVTLAWDASPDSGVGGYRLHYGTTSGSYSLTTNAGSATSVTVQGLSDGVTYYFAVTAVGTNQLESDFSNEISYNTSFPSNSTPTLNNVNDVTIVQAEGEPGLNLGAMGAGTMIWAVAAGGPPQTQAVTLTGIGTGGEPSQTLSVTASSSNPGLVPNPTVIYSSPASTGSLQLAPAVGAIGSAQITVTVTDDGGGADTIEKTFVVDVDGPANSVPTITTVASQSMTEDGVLGPVGFTVNDAQTSAGSLVVTASSGNAALIANSALQLGGVNTSRNVTVSPAANQSGKALVALTVTDAQGAIANKSFWVTVSPVNDAPTFNSVSAVNLAGDQIETVSLAGIGAGPLDGIQGLTVQASSSDPSIVADPEVVYYSPNAVAELQLAPVEGASGSATITVTVRDDGGTANGGQDTRTRTFTVTTASQVAAASVSEQTIETSGAASLAAPQPSLQISTQDGLIVLSWDGNAGHYAVERSSGPDLEGDWTAVEALPESAGGSMLKLALQPSLPMEFFRLARAQ